MDNSELKKLDDRTLGSEELYAHQYDAEATTWARAGVYESVATLAELREGATHLDIGSGLGTLLKVVKRRCAGVTLIGVDSNRAMIEAARSSMQKSGIPVKVDGVTQLKPKGRDVSRDFSAQGNIEELKSDQVRLVLDDIRKKKVLQAVLNGRALDSVSFTMPGTYAGMLLEGPFPVKATSQAELVARLTPCINEVKRSAYEFATENVRPGGKLVIAERTAGELSEETLAEDMHALLGDLRGFWNIRSICFNGIAEISPLGRGNAANAIQWVPLNSAAQQQANERHVVITSFERK